MAYLPPPKSLDVNMHYFQPGAGDVDLPPSMTTVLATLRPNEYLIRGKLNSLEFFSAYVYNPGSGVPEQYYDSYNIVPGDWLATDATGFTWKITTMFTITDAPNPGNNTGQGVFYAIMLDVDAFNAGIDPGMTFNGAPVYIDSRAVLFTLDEDGFPIFTPSDTFNLSQNFSGNVIGRFRILNTYNQYVSIYQTDASGTFVVGDPVYIDASGQFQKSQGIGDVSGVSLTIGIVTSVGVPSPNYFTFNPFGEYRPNLGLTGPPGTVYYVDPTGVSQYTVTRPAVNPFPVYQIIDTSGNAVLVKGQLGQSGSGSGGTGPTGPTGPTGDIGAPGDLGPTGPTGAVIYTAIIFDGGHSTTTYPLGPAFDCGTSV